MRTRIFETNGLRKKSGAHPVLVVLLIAYVIFVIYMLLSYRGHIRVYGPGPLLIYIIWRATQGSPTQPVSIWIDGVGSDLFLGLRTADNKFNKDYLIDEYTYWFVPSKQGDNRVDLIVKIKPPGEDAIFLTEKNVYLQNAIPWAQLNERPSGTNVYNAHYLEGMAYALDYHSTPA